MKPAWILALFVCASTAAAQSTTAPSAAPIFPPSLANTPGAQKMWAAATPSDAVAVYAASAPTVSGDELTVVEQAYVRRMVEFGLPAMAESQAAEVTRHKADDGVAWGVLAFMNARRNNSDEALAQIAKAAEYAPDELFVQRTAGELLAWLDTRADAAKVSPEAKQAADEVRQRMRDRSGFAEGYSAARDDYANQEGGAPVGPTVGRQMYGQLYTAPTAPSVQEYATPDPGVVQTPIYNNYYYNYYTDPYAYVGYPAYYAPYWPTSYLYFSSSYRRPFYGFQGFNNFHRFNSFSSFNRFGRPAFVSSGFRHGLTPYNAIRFAPTNSLNFGFRGSGLPSRFGGASMRFAPAFRGGMSPMGGMRSMPGRAMGRMR